MDKVFIAALIVVAGWFAAVPAQATPVLSLSPSVSSTTVGGSVVVNLVISGLTASSEIVSGFDLDVFFNPSVLSASVLSTAFAPWGTGADVILSQNFIAAGHVEFQLVALNPDATLAALQGDSFVLSTITFTGLLDGFSNINFGPDPDFERNVVGRGSLSLPLVVQGACVAVGTGTCLQTVPEPGTIALVLLALLVAGFAVRPRRRV